MRQAVQVVEQQRVLGVLGGMAWPSTLEAYRQLNDGVQLRRGGHHSARLVVISVDFAEVEALQASGDWAAAGALLADAARGAEAAGAGALLLCTNTMHKVADAITEAVGIPLLHVADATAQAARAAGWEQVGLLGTRFTMEDPTVVRHRLEARGLQVLVPEAQDRELVHRIIYEELTHDVVMPASRDAYRDVTRRLEERGAQAVIAGCTEIELLLGEDDVTGGWLPTTRLSVDAGLAWLLADPTDPR